MVGMINYPQVDKIIKKRGHIRLGGKMMIKCCNEHIDLALDIYVDKYEVPPEMELLSDEEKLSTVCEFCQNKATYVVGN